MLFEAFHSKGEFNTLSYKSKSLDKILNRSQKAKTLKDFYAIQKKAMKVLKEKEPLLMRLKKASYNVIYKKTKREEKKLQAVIQYLDRDEHFLMQETFLYI